jgi:hypothetical protein
MEIWKAVVGYEGLYEVSSLGRVRSLPHIVPNRSSKYTTIGKVLRQAPDRRGYLQVHLSSGKKVETKKVHRLVATAFIGEPPQADSHVNHRDFKVDNNAATNLEWCSSRQNIRHSVLAGRLDATVSPRRAKKLTAETVGIIRAASASGEPNMRIAKRIGVSRRTIDRIISGKIWVRALITPPPAALQEP